jgi:endo-alpha-1,4-polygalactosaminidase (GH114 family)
VRRKAAGAVMISIIVNLYNMRREAARTLFTLSQRYQRDVQTSDYEVIVVENGSIEPVGGRGEMMQIKIQNEPEWVRKFNQIQNKLSQMSRVNGLLSKSFIFS